jgi:hypothetical protein
MLIAIDNPDDSLEDAERPVTSVTVCISSAGGYVIAVPKGQ